MRGYRYQTRRGPIYIVARDGRWQLVFEGESLGSYHSPRAAADDAAGGHTFTPSSGIDLATLGIPDGINEWEVY